MLALSIELPNDGTDEVVEGLGAIGEYAELITGMADPDAEISHQGGNKVDLFLGLGVLQAMPQALDLEAPPLQLTDA
jgi:hypothetical protein